LINNTYRPLTAFDRALAGLGQEQRRMLRFLLTGASLQMVAMAMGIERRRLLELLSDHYLYRPAFEALQHDLQPEMRATLNALTEHELTHIREAGLDADSRAMLAIIRAVGRLDTEVSVLAHSALHPRWLDSRHSSHVNE
jgi:hypothetical protein